MKSPSLLLRSLATARTALVFGTVTDFVNFHFFPVFNVADSAITIGVIALIASYVLRKSPAG